MASFKRHWAHKKENGSYFAIKLLLLMYRFGGRWVLKALLAPVLLYFLCKDKSARSASLQYLHQLHDYMGPASPFAKKPGIGLTYQHFWNFAMAALAKVDAWVGRLSLDHVQYGGSANFQTMVEKREGAVLIGSHLGNLEVCRALIRSKYPTRINVLVHTQHSAAFQRILQESNHEVTLALIEVTDLTPAISVLLQERIEQGELVVIVGDRVSVQAPERAVWANFLGCPAPFAVGPWVLASVLKCPVYLMFSMQESKQKFNVILEPFAPQVCLLRQNRQQALAEYVTRYAKQLEDVAMRYPLQWFNFYDYWQLPTALVEKEQDGDSHTCS